MKPGLTLLVFGAAGILTAGSMPAAEAAELLVRLESAAPVSTEVRLTPRFGDHQIIRTTIPQAASEARFTDLAGGAWEIDVQAAGWWAPREVIMLKAGRQHEVSTSLLPTARLQGSYSARGGVVDGTTLRLRLKTPSGEARDEDFIAIECPLSSGRFACVAPAGLWDVRMRLPGHASHHLWGIELTPAEPRDLGRVEFVRGGSIVGWAPACAGEAEESPCSVSITPWLGDDESARQTRQVEGLRQIGRIDRRGFFQFEGVAAGTYTLVAKRGTEAARRLFPLHVYGSAETELAQPLVLEPLLDLALSIEPANDPRGESWRFVVEEVGISGRTTRTIANDVLRDGRWTGPGLTSGRYRLALRDAGGSQWLWEELEVSKDSAAFHFRLPMVEVEGIALLGDEPLAAQLWFGGRRGARRIQTHSDEEGRFEVVLPEPGRWSVEVSSAELEIQRTLSAVEVAEPEGEGAAELEIRLPDTLVSGHVVDPAGERARGAVVTLVDPAAGERPVILRSDDQGEFTVRGLGFGQISASARRGQMQSDDVDIRLSKGSPNGRIVLALQHTHEIRGVVTSAHGPVAGAQVTWYGLETLSGSTMVTGSDGRFSARLGDFERVLNVMVLPPGLVFTVDRWPVEREESVVHVEDLGGTLLLPGGFEALDQAADGTEGRMVFYARGVAVDLGTLRQWWETQRSLGASVMNEVGIAIPQMGSGEYSVCRSSGSGAHFELSLPAAGGNLPCVTAYLPPGGIEILDVSRLEK